MAARSKYANLPGINDDNMDENVEVLKIDSRKAYDSFKGRYLDSNESDFSDNIGMKHRKGYCAKTEYEILGESKEKERPDQKYQRLQHEMRELAEELEQIKDASLDEKEAKKLSPVTLAQEVKVLQQQHNFYTAKSN
ncbi:Dynactin subunit 2 [Exaiptasia diaphana]|nr:Dynactin subunit 2 [Exaiptasia diaphana]